MTYMAAFGLASGAGAKAFIPVLALGAAHYTPYFELSERFQWICNPAVMVILAVMVVLEIVVDAHPELGRWTDTVAYLPKMVAGFIAFAASAASSAVITYVPLTGSSATSGRRLTISGMASVSPAW